MSEAILLAPADYAVRRLAPHDAAGVNACVRAIYGNSYIHDELYHPDQLLKLNNSGELVSVVALGPQQQVVGHYALERPGLRPVAEGGEAMVLPEHRRHQLMERMRSLLEEEAQRLSLRGLYGHAVTNHIFSQRSDERYSEQVCAISLGWSPQSFQNMGQPLSQRMSDVLYFKYLHRPDHTTAYLPARHAEICLAIYSRLEVRPQTDANSASNLPDATSAIDVEYRESLQRAVIHVRQSGAATLRDLTAAVGALRAKGAQAVFLELPLAQPQTPVLCEQADQLGFFFSGLGPSFAADGDVLRLQWLAGPLDASQLQLASPLARDLLAYIERDRARVDSRTG